MTWKELLLWLQIADKQVTPKLLKEELGLGPGEAWTRLERLRAFGYLRRVKDEHRKNSACYELTSQGKNKVFEENG